MRLFLHKGAVILHENHQDSFQTSLSRSYYSFITNKPLLAELFSFNSDSGRKIRSSAFRVRGKCARLTGSYNARIDTAYPYEESLRMQRNVSAAWISSEVRSYLMQSSSQNIISVVSGLDAALSTVNLQKMIKSQSKYKQNTHTK